MSNGKLIVGTMGLLTIVLLSAGGPAHASEQAASFLSVKGVQIVDPDGQPVILRGVNYPGYDDCNTFSKVHTEKAYQSFALAGFNVVRLPFTLDKLEVKPETFDLSFAVRYFDQDVQWAKKYGIYVILDMHQWKWAHKFGGCGLPDWAVKQYGTSQAEMKRAISDFWANAKLQGYVIDAWVELARYYANEAAIAGYDLFNEPWINVVTPASDHAKKVTAFYTSAIGAIRAVDPNHMILLEPAVSDMYSLPVAEENIVWSPHFYPLSFESKYYHENATILESVLAQKYKQIVVGFGAPMWIGEFGAFMGDASSDAWHRDAQALFDKYELGWAWWAYDERLSPFPAYLAPSSASS